MASVNYMKLHGRADVARIARHCDVRERQQHEHSNIHIDKTKTDKNGQMKSRGFYSDTMAYYDNRIADLDATTNTNKRRDRVTAFALEIPKPEQIPMKQFSLICMNRIREMYGRNNIVNFYIHNDEQHDYMDHGEIRTSLDHVHAIVIPEIDGRLNGKKFSSKSNMKKLNQMIDADCRSCGFTFMTGAEPRKRTVEELKRASEKEIQELYDVKGKYERLRKFAGRYKTKTGQSITEEFDKTEMKRGKSQDIER